MSTARQQIRVRWEGNESTRFDGVTQDVALKLVVPEDAVSARVGGTVRVKWGRGSRARFWKGVVVSMDVDQPLSPSPAPDTQSTVGKGKGKAKANTKTGRKRKRAPDAGDVNGKSSVYM